MLNISLKTLLVTLALVFTWHAIGIVLDEIKKRRQKRSHDFVEEIIQRAEKNRTDE